MLDLVTIGGGFGLGVEDVGHPRVIGSVRGTLRGITPNVGIVLCKDRTQNSTHDSDSVSLLLLVSGSIIALRSGVLLATPLCSVRLRANIRVGPFVRSVGR